MDEIKNMMSAINSKFEREKKLCLELKTVNHIKDRRISTYKIENPKVDCKWGPMVWETMVATREKLLKQN